MAKKKMNFFWSIVTLILKIVVASPFLLLFGYVGWAFLVIPLIKYDGVCIKGVLLNEMIYAYRHKPTLAFEFAYRGKQYRGDSLIEDSHRAGDSICVTFLDWEPEKNRPLSYYDSPNCGCK